MNISFSQSNSIQKTDNLRWEEAANLETAVKPHVTFTVYGLLNCFNTNTFAIHRKTMSWVKGCCFFIVTKEYPDTQSVDLEPRPLYQKTEVYSQLI